MKHLLIFLGLLISFSISTFSQNIDLQKLDNYFEKSSKDWGVPGMSIAIVKNGEIVFSKGYGVLETGKPDKPDGNTLYAIASNSKAFTSTLIAMLAEEKKLNMDDKVQKYLPYFELYDPWVSREATIRDLLSHRIGLGTFSGDFIWYKSSLHSEEIIRRIKYLPKAFNFRDGYGYSNLMYITAGEIIKKVTGKSWGENVQERILKPLKMDRTIVSLSKLKEKGNFATPHALENNINIPIPWVDWEEIGALGGIISSVNDIGNWMIFNMNKGIAGNDTLLSGASFNMITKMHNSFLVNRVKVSDSNMHFNGYGLGWALSDFYGRIKISHSGGYDGMISAVTMIPEEKLGVVVLTNGLKSPASAITNYAISAFMNLTEKDWSSEMLSQTKSREKNDTRIAKRIEQHVMGTKPSVDLKKYSGTYYSDIYGKIIISQKNNNLFLDFEHSPDLSAQLEHWHYDVWKINWNKTHAWFSFGTIKFNMDNNLKITGMDFDVPNDDIFFEELKPVRIGD